MDELRSKIQKLSSILNVILIISMIWFLGVTILNGLSFFIPIEQYFPLIGVDVQSGFISSALTLFVLIQLRIIVKQSKQLTPFSEASQKALETMAYVELAKFFYILLMLLLMGEGLNFDFSYLMFSGVLLVLVNVFKFAEHQSEEFIIQTELLKWMNIGLILNLIFWIFMFFIFVLTAAMLGGLFQWEYLSNDPIMNEPLFVMEEMLPEIRLDLTGKDIFIAMPAFLAMISITAFTIIYVTIQIRKVVKVMMYGNPFDEVILKATKKISILFIVTGVLQAFSGFIVLNTVFINSWLAIIYSVSFIPFVAGILVLLLYYLFQYGQNLKG